MERTVSLISPRLGLTGVDGRNRLWLIGYLVLFRRAYERTATLRTVKAAARRFTLAGEAVYCAGPVTRTRQVASCTRSMMSSRSVAGATSADGGVNSTLANALLTAQLMFCGMESVARMHAGADAVKD